MEQPLGSWEQALVCLKPWWAHKSPGVLLKYRLWFSRSGVGPRMLEVQQIPRLCWCCWSTVHAFSRKGKLSTAMESLFDPTSATPCDSFFWVVSPSFLWHSPRFHGESCLSYCCSGANTLRPLPFLVPWTVLLAYALGVKESLVG